MQSITKVGFVSVKNNTRKKPVRSITHFIIISIFFMATNSNAFAQPSAKDIRGAAPVVPLTSEPPPKLFVDPPLAEPLSLGRVFIQYRADNIHFVPVYGPGALTVSPRVGHVHVTVDNAPWHWADASNESIIIVGMAAGSHRILIELADPTHKIIDRQTINFVIPSQKAKGKSRP